MERIREAIEQKIRPALNAHNGDIEFVEMTSDGLVKVKLTGACATCPGAQQTLSEVVEVALKEVCPEVRGVQPIFEVSDDLIQQALRILRQDKSFL